MPRRAFSTDSARFVATGKPYRLDLGTDRTVKQQWTVIPTKAELGEDLPAIRTLTLPHRWTQQEIATHYNRIAPHFKRS